MYCLYMCFFSLPAIIGDETLWQKINLILNPRTPSKGFVVLCANKIRCGGRVDTGMPTYTSLKKGGVIMSFLIKRSNVIDEMIGVNHSPAWGVGETGDITLLCLNKQWVFFFFFF